jgi:hypothetical protein
LFAVAIALAADDIALIVAVLIALAAVAIALFVAHHLIAIAIARFVAITITIVTIARPPTPSPLDCYVKEVGDGDSRCNGSVEGDGIGRLWWWQLR